MTNDLLDLTISLKVVQSLAGKAAVDLETIDEGGDGDQAVRLNILLQLVVGGLVEDDGVLGLVLDCKKKDLLVTVVPLLRIFPARSTISFAMETRRKSSRSHGW